MKKHSSGESGGLSGIGGRELGHTWLSSMNGLGLTPTGGGRIGGRICCWGTTTVAAGVTILAGGGVPELPGTTVAFLRSSGGGPFSQDRIISCRT